MDIIIVGVGIFVLTGIAADVAGPARLLVFRLKIFSAPDRDGLCGAWNAQWANQN
jgi:hypothetical protein